MEGFEFEWDFSQLSAVELSKEKITIAEIKSVYLNKYSVLEDISNYENTYLFYLIGFSEKKRFIRMFFEVDTKIIPHLILIADEINIRREYCKFRE